MGEFVRAERRGSVLLVTIDRPKALNALNRLVLDELSAILDEIDDARALVLTGGGEKAFVAGADIAAMADLDALTAHGFAAFGQSVLDKLEALPIPTIAAVNGFALGGGCELAMACDLTLASKTAVFGQPEVKLGVIPGFGGTQRLVRRVGSQRARELCFTGRNVKVDEAVQIGLALRACDDVVAEALALAEQIAANGPVAVQLCKRAILDNDGQPLSAALISERQLFGLCFATQDQKEGMAAFLGKRKAAFSGK
ncbi:short-chain-enoyl-CoA hydratase [Deltaproteobacteria bacterium]|nr:short-chain-enoyl-CoA hydratase [Deltaproteobacteria bacterium]